MKQQPKQIMARWSFSYITYLYLCLLQFSFSFHSVLASTDFGYRMHSIRCFLFRWCCCLGTRIIPMSSGLQKFFHFFWLILLLVVVVVAMMVVPWLLHTFSVLLHSCVINCIRITEGYKIVARMPRTVAGVSKKRTLSEISPRK